MKRNFLLIFFLIFFHCSFSQKTIWHEVHIDSFLSVSLPDNVVEIDTFYTENGKSLPVKMFTASTASSDIAVIFIQVGGSGVNPYKNNSGLKKALDQLKAGVRQSIESAGFKSVFNDTVINDVFGFKSEIFDNDSKAMLNRKSYNFCINSLSYSVVFVPVEDSLAAVNEDLDKLLRSIRFNKERILDDYENNDYSSYNWQKIGEASGTLIIAGVIIFAVYRNSKRKNQAGKIKNEL